MARRKNTVIDRIIEKSGNSFHSRVVRLLRNENWTVIVSPYYSDNFTEKPREIDIIAERAFDIYDFPSRWLGTLNIRLLIECKYINKDTVFWFDDKDQNRVIERVMNDTGMDHPYRNANITKHHYFIDEPVAKLFSSEKNRGEDNEVMNKAINQNLNALIYYRNRNDLISHNSDKPHKVLKRISYPIIAVNSFRNFFQTNMSDEIQNIESITEPFQLEVNYAYMDKDKNGRNEYFLIDILSIEKLSEFLAMLEEKDINTTKAHISWNHRMSGDQD